MLQYLLSREIAFCPETNEVRERDLNTDVRVRETLQKEVA